VAGVAGGRGAVVWVEGELSPATLSGHEWAARRQAGRA